MESSSTFETTTVSPVLLPNQTTTTTTKKKKEMLKKKSSSSQHEHVQPWPRKKGVTLEASYAEPGPTTYGYGSSSSTTAAGHASSPPAAAAAAAGSRGPVVAGRTRSLTDDDLEELKGCLDLGFGFSYHEIPELCSTLPALELCYSMGQSFLDDRRQKSSPPPPPPPPVANWKFSSPGDDPEEVKARLKYWAQAVACTVRLCS